MLIASSQLPYREGITFCPVMIDKRAAVSLNVQPVAARQAFRRAPIFLRLSDISVSVVVLCHQIYTQSVNNTKRCLLFCDVATTINIITVNSGFNVELNPWIESLARIDPVAVAVEVLGEKRRTIDSWRRFERVPSFRAALNIVKKSGGRVDFNGIYNPFWRAAEEGNAKF